MKSFKKGFTLAELIIVIGVVGLVAALTLPALISNHNKNVYTNQLKKAYSNLANAYKMQYNSVPIDEYCSYSSQDDCTKALAKVLGGTEILLTGLQTERLAYQTPLMFSQNLLSTLNSAFIPAAYAAYSSGSLIMEDGYLYYDGYVVANGCEHSYMGHYYCYDSKGEMVGGRADTTDDYGNSIFAPDYGDYDRVFANALDPNAYNAYYGNSGSDSYDGSYDDSNNSGSNDSTGDSYDNSYDNYDDSYDESNDDDNSNSNAGTTGPVATGNTFYQYKTTPTGLSGKESYFTDYSNTTAIKTKDNTVYYFANSGKEIFIDVNSTKRGPNAGGRDIFYFQKLDRDNSNPAYRIKPYDGGEGYTCDKDNVSIGCTEKLLSEGKMNY